MRRPIIAGNWKMHKTIAEARQLAEALKKQQGEPRAEIVLCPPFTALAAVAAIIKDSPIALGAQNMHWEEQGAFTGEVSPAMLKDVGCAYVIVGHSERRQYFGETDEQVNVKAKAALTHGLIPIVCVGETLAQREAGETEAIVAAQTRGALAGLTAEAVAGLVIAYEPVWAIGTGKTASDDDAQQVIADIRATVAAEFGKSAAEALRIQYGGSVKAANAASLLSRPDIDGALVGGASLKAGDFQGIIDGAQ
ncbi:triose-phosphate isomerase [Heliobacterium gestii]|uniref:Triosephosphate isomerase n=1 Tax=Heliomicrobium gestii TaxID=2699 RepID=A0A845LDJ6_HELGE|nr:triose-phosphate isomerase [Heliomicrobium gestii]MBM7865965.1 triosephosphate isomerase [Heliomicrobium gestii]MZP42699.1 triose-phosphate isomerase [Heliomicrobium gestii]